ncbi:MAG TPA: hypothetical protein VJU14_02535 [Solirubrobacterales bacterium]|nr:hypothetical protein [Solirubrobacterales bacterium]
MAAETEPNWQRPAVRPRITERRIKDGNPGEVEISVPPEIAHDLVGSPQHPAPKHSSKGETLWSLGAGRQIRWNRLGEFCRARGIDAADLAARVRRFDPEDVAEVFDAGPWDSASELSEAEWTRLARGLSELIGEPVTVEQIAPWEVNRPGEGKPPKRDGEAKELTPSLPPRGRGGSAADAAAIAERRDAERHAAQSAEAAEIRRDLTVLDAERKLGEVKDRIANAPTLRDRLRRRR